MRPLKNQHGFLHTYVSVDCVVFGFDGEKLNVLLVERTDNENNVPDFKLPGSVIYYDEEADESATRVLYELTGVKKVPLKQFKCFSSIDRTKNPADIKWLEKAYKHDIGRVITIAYIAITKINRKLHSTPNYKNAAWVSIDKVGKMPFDHNQIIEESHAKISRWILHEPSVVFELLPSKFTAAELRKLYESIYRKPLDVRNFHKKISTLEYIVPLDEFQKNVAHRAARYYKFDKVLYNKRKSSI